MTKDLFNIDKKSNSKEFSEVMRSSSNPKPLNICQYIENQYKNCLKNYKSYESLPSDTLSCDSVFLTALNELNKYSIFIENAKEGELFFYNIAQFNYLTHNYKYAKDNFEKSKRLEHKDLNVSNVEVRFRKRLLLCLCKEYIAIDTIEEDKKNKLFLDALFSLVGLELNNNITSKENDRSFVGNNLIFFEEDPPKSIPDIVNNLTQEGLVDKNEDSVLRFINTAHRTFEDNEQYNKWLFEIVHVFAHCLSEHFEKADSPLNIYYKRLAEILMKKLGDEYATCYATIKMENHEYFSAIHHLYDVRKKYTDTCKNNKEIEKNASIAEIDFYYWYYSICADCCSIGEKYKNYFYNYCNKTQDQVAKIYYHILNMKEQLINGFDQLNTRNPTSEMKKNIESSYAEFKKNKPRYMIHNEIIKEWKFLDKSFKIYQICFDITNRYRQVKDMQINIPNIQMDIYDLYLQLAPDNENKVEQFSLKTSLQDSEACFYIVTASKGKFFFKGRISELIDSSNSLNIRIIKITPINLDILGDKLKEPVYRNFTNVLVLANDDYFNNDQIFIDKIIEFDLNESSINKHNIYIDVSQLSKKNKEIYLSKQNNHKLLGVFSSTKSSILLCSLFSAIEVHLQTLKKRLDSHIISPVEKDKAFFYQYCNIIPLQSPNLDLKFGSIPPWGNVFEACSSPKDSNKFKGVFLNLESLLNRLGDNCPPIDYIFRFESHKRSQSVKTETDIFEFEIDLCAFRINGNYKNNGFYDLDDNYIAGDIIIIQELCKGRPDFMLSLKKLYEDTPADLHEHCQHRRKVACCSRFTSVEIKDNVNYETLRKYLYSYLGILLDKETFILIQDQGLNGTLESGECYLLCAFHNDNFYNIPKEKVCSALRQFDNYIVYDLNEAKHVPREIINQNDEEIQLMEQLKAKLHEKHINLSKKDKFIFISYKSQDNTPRLCIPVFKDLLYLQNEYKNVKWIIDVNSFGNNFVDEIKKYINSSMCIGCFIYLSEEYLHLTDDSKSRDMCLEEMLLIKDRVKETKKNKFFVIPIFLKDKNNNPTSPNELIKKIIEKAISGEHTDDERSKALNWVLKMDGSQQEIGREYGLWNDNQNHLKHGRLRDTIINHLRQNSVL